jgi:putative ABC transport system permease protein
MNSLRLIRASLNYYWRTHLGVLLGAAAGAAVLVGALAVGDCVRYSLEALAIRRLGNVELAMASNDRFFRAVQTPPATSPPPNVGSPRPAGPQAATPPGCPPPDEDLASDLQPALGTMPAPALMLDGSAATPDGAARANLVQVIGVDARLWVASGMDIGPAGAGSDQAVINTHLARQLGVAPGHPIVLRVPKPSGLPREAPLGSDRDTVASISVTVRAVIDDDHFGRFSLRANQLAPLTAFLPLGAFQDKVGLPGRANVLLVGGDRMHGSGSRANCPLVPPGPPCKCKPPTAAQADAALRERWQLPDAGLSLRDLPGGVLELRTSRVFLDPPVARAAVAAATATGRRPLRVLTYFVNEARLAGKAAPYCIVAAMDADPAASPVPPGLADSEIILNDWLAEDLAAKVGDFVELAFQVPGPMRTFQDRTRTFRVRAIVPIAGPAANRDLMPDFPGLAGVKDCRDWKPGVPIDLKKIRKKDEAYWTAHGGTPKAFVTLAAGQQMWGNRFGDLTAVRYVAAQPAASASAPASAPATPSNPRDLISRAILRDLNPAEIGLFFQPVRQQALAAANPTSDFGGLFLGLSFFLIISAVLLTGLLFVFNVEQRSRQTGTLLAVGFRPWRVRRMLLGEGAVLALGGCVLGAAAGLAYAWLVLLGLRTVWRGATASAPILYHVEGATALTGAAIGLAVAVAAMLITLMLQGRATARELLSAGAEGRASRPAGRGKLIVGACVGVACIGGAVTLVVMALRKEFTDVAGAFFGSGGLLLLGSLSLGYVLLGALGRGARCENASGGGTGAESGGRGRSAGPLGLARLGLRTCGRRRWRSLTTAGLLACGVFLVASVEVFRLDPTRSSDQRTSGTGGFALYGESAVPVLNDLNDPAWRRKRGLDDANLPGVDVVQIRLHEGDDASCLNLNRAQTPRLLGVDPRLLTGRFTFQQTLRDTREGWSLLDRPAIGGISPLFGSSPVPVMIAGKPAAGGRMPAAGTPKMGTGTEAANSMPLRSQSPFSDDAPIPAVGDEGTLRWALQKAVGDTMEVTDERGRKVKLQFVGQLAGSVLQGSLVISEADFRRLYPSASGYRVFLVDAPPGREGAVSRAFTAALQDFGLALTPTVRRLGMFGEVQNTYLSIFAALGGLGLLLGSVGLGVVVLRNVLERRGELALLRAVGFSRGQLRSLVLYEHWALLALGLLCGTASAVIAVLPALQSPTADLPYASWLAILAGVTISGVLWTWLAATAALRGDLLPALRTE